MPSMRSIGRTDSRMMASAFSTSFMRSADMRASGVSMLCASFIRRSASASISARTRSAIDLILSASASASACARTAAPRSALASFSACAALVRRSASRSAAWAAPISSIAFLRSAISTSRAVNTFSSADTASARAVSASACASLCVLLSRAMAMARCCSASSSAWRRSISAAWMARSLPMRSCSMLCSLRMRAASMACLAADLRAFGRLLALRALGGHLGTLAGACDLHLALLRQPRVLALAVDVERQLLGLEVLVADGDQRVLLDIVALLLALLDLLGQARQALGVEGVAGVEELHAGLVQLRQRRAFQLQAVLRQVAGHRLAHALDVAAALFVQLLHRHLGGGRAQRVDELALDQFLQLLGFHRAQAQRLRRRGHRFGLRRDAHVELGDHVDAHAVLGDQRLVAAAADLQAQRVHVHRDHVVHDRQHEGAAVEHHLLAAQAGAHEGALLAAAQVQPVQQPHGDGHDDRDDDQAEDEASEICTGHGGVSFSIFSICMKRRVVSVSATSVGSRSIELAP